MDLSSYIGVIWRRRLLLLLLVAVALVTVWTIGQPDAPSGPTYTVDSTLALKERDTQESVLLYAHIATRTGQIRQAAAEQLGPDLYGDDPTTISMLELNLDVTPVPEIGAITLTLDEQPDEMTGLRAIGAVGDQLIAYARERNVRDRDERLVTLEEQQVELEKQIDEMETELDRLQALQPLQDREAGRSPDRVLDIRLASATSSLDQVLIEARTLRAATGEDLSPLAVVGLPTAIEDEMESAPLGVGARSMVAVTIALVLGCGLAFALHRVDTRVFTRKDAEGAFQLPSLAEIPSLSWRRRRNHQIATLASPHSTAARAHRVLRTSIARARQNQVGAEGSASGATVLLVTSVSAGVGKTTTVANLAVAAIDAGQRVLVVSADLRDPMLHRFFGVDPTAGLLDASGDLRREDDVDDVVDRYLLSTTVENVTILPHGSEGLRVPNSGEALASVRPLIDAYRSRFDVILVDTPPMSAGNDVGELLPTADLVLLVARAERTTLDEGEWAQETTARFNAPVCGLVLVGARSSLERSRTSAAPTFATLTRLWHRLVGQNSRGVRLGRNWATTEESQSETEGVVDAAEGEEARADRGQEAATANGSDPGEMVAARLRARKATSSMGPHTTQLVLRDISDLHERGDGLVPSTATPSVNEPVPSDDIQSLLSLVDDLVWESAETGNGSSRTGATSAAGNGVAATPEWPRPSVPASPPNDVESGGSDDSGDGPDQNGDHTMRLSVQRPIVDEPDS